MLKQNLEADIHNSLVMSDYYLSSNKPYRDIIISLYHSSKKITLYHDEHSSDELNSEIFIRFKGQYERFFKNKDISKLNEEIIEIVRSTKQIIKGWTKFLINKNGSVSTITSNSFGDEQTNTTKREHTSKINYVHSRYSQNLLKKSKISERLELDRNQHREHHSVAPSQDGPFFSQKTQNINNSNFNHFQTNIIKNIPQSNRKSFTSQEVVDETFIKNLNSLKNSISDDNNYALNDDNNIEEKTFEKMVQEVIEEYSKHKLDSAAQLADKTIKYFDTMKIDVRNKMTIQKQQLSEILFQYKQMMSYYSNFDMAGWKFDKQDKGVKIYLRTQDKSSQCGVLVEAQFDVNPSNFFVLASQVDLFHKYIPFCYDCKQLKRISRNTMYGSSKIMLPVISNRQLLFYSVAIDRLDINGSIFIYSKTIHNDIRSQQKYQITIPPEQKCVRLQYNFFVMQCQILSRNKVKIRLASSVDMKLNFLPNWVLTLAARKFVADTFMNMLKYERQFQKTQWANRKRQKSDRYGFFDKIRQQYLQKLEARKK